MRALVGAELKKLATTRMPFLLAVGAVVISTVTVLDPEHSAATFQKPFDEQTFVLFSAMLTRILIVVLGVRAMTDEVRYNTIVPTFLVTPSRTKVLGAKAIAVGAAGAAIALLAWASMFAAASVIAASDGTSIAFDAGVTRSLIGTVGAGAAWAIVGLGVGAIVRGQVLATVGSVLWLMGIEEAVRGWLGDLDRYLPGQAGLAMAIAPTMKALLLGGGVMIAYALITTLASGLAIRRDVA